MSCNSHLMNAVITLRLVNYMSPAVWFILLSVLFLVRHSQILCGQGHLRRYSDLTLAPPPRWQLLYPDSSFSIHLDSLLEKLLKADRTHEPTLSRGVAAVKSELHAPFFFCPHFVTSFFTGAMVAARKEKTRSGLLLKQRWWTNTLYGT